MVTQWQTLLTQQATAQTFSGDAQPAICPLADWAVVSVQGEEAATFLQNLLINDINAIEPAKAQFSGFCNPKGRLLATFWLLRQNDTHYQLVMPQAQATFISQRLTLFKLRSKVEITLSADTKVCGLLNNHTENAFAIAANRALLTAPEAQVAEQLAGLVDNGSTLFSAADWQLMDIRAGLPMIYESSREQFTAQQLNLDLIGAVSFRKGCYPGQEVIARLHYLGEPKRRLFSGEATAQTLPEPGAEVFDQQGNVAGHLVQAQRLSETALLLQLSLKLSSDLHTLQLNADAPIQSVTAQG